MSGGGLDPPLEMMVHVWGGVRDPPLGMMVCNRSVTAKNMPYFGDFQLEFHTSDGNGRIPLGKRLILLCFVVF